MRIPNVLSGTTREPPLRRPSDGPATQCLNAESLESAKERTRRVPVPIDARHLALAGFDVDPK